MSSSPNTISSVRMEINGRPFYIKSKNNVPYIYDVDTHDEVGYWSSKKGAYVMFSLYNKIINDMKQKKYQQEQDHSDSTDSLDGDGDCDERDDETSDSELEENDKQKKVEVASATDNTDAITDAITDASTDSNTDEKKSENTNYSLIMLFLVLFVYLTLQKELQSIYFDFIFLILLNLLNTMKVFEIMDDE